MSTERRLTVHPQTGESVFNLSGMVANILVCLTSSLMFVEIHMQGRMFLPEILLACMLPWLLRVRGYLLIEGIPRRLLLLGLFWLLAQVTTDLIRDTPFSDWSRGWSKIIFLLLDFSSIYLLMANRAGRYFMFAIGIAIGQILQYFFDPNDFAAYWPWKFGYGTAITLLFVLGSSMFFSANKGMSSKSA